MFRLVERTRQEGVKHHRLNPIRVYETDPVQKGRIERSRAAVYRALAELGRPQARIYELGCGTGDIAGHFSSQHRVTGIDCHEPAILKARERFPAGDWLVGLVDTYEPQPTSVVVLCETLEHIEDPAGLVKSWLSVSDASVISHPVGEPMGSGLSGGDHCWSFSEEDFRGWFEMGGHELLETEFVSVGSYRVALGRGRRKGRHV